MRPPRWWLSNRQNPKSRFAPVAAYYASKLANASTTAQHQETLKNLTVDAWLAGVFGAGKALTVISDALTDDQTLGATDWVPGWAEGADLPDDLPADLQALLDSIDNAQNPENEDDAAAQADTASAYAADDGAQAAYSAGGVEQWNSVADAGACEFCLSKEDGSPYSLDEDGPPWHNGCGCESEPIDPS